MQESALKKKVLKIAEIEVQRGTVQSHTIICYLFCGLFIIYLWGYSRISLGLVKNPVKEHPDIPIYNFFFRFRSGKEFLRVFHSSHYVR